MNHKECQDMRDSISALVMGELAPAAAEELRKHLESCEACRSARDAMAEEEKAVRAGFQALARSLETTERALGERLAERSPNLRLHGQAAKQPKLQGIRNMIAAHKRLAIAAAAAVLVAAAGFVYLASSPVSTAYAIEQTSQASREIRNYHTRITPPIAGGPVLDRAGEVWAQVDDQGQLIRLRADLPNTEDGPKVAFWQEQKASVWLKAKNLYVTVKDPTQTDRIKDLFVFIDPKCAFERLDADRRAGKVQVRTGRAKQKGGPFEVTVTTRDQPNKREVWLVDGRTKLVQQWSKYELINGEWAKTMTCEYLDYNQRIPAEIWSPQLPADIVRIDQTTQTIGLSRGNLSENEIAVKVAREFFEALIAKDYAKAGQILEGMPASRVRQAFGGVKVLRIVEVGQPHPDADPRTKFVIVPVKVEIERDGQKVIQDFAPGIRAAYKQPDRWVISGHI